MFEKFWEIYPKKIGKGKAYESWNKIDPSIELQEKIILAIKKQMKSIQWQKNNGQYIPLPVTWLNQDRWNDELDESATKLSDTTLFNIRAAKNFIGDEK